MKIPFVIGKNSNDKIQLIDLANIPLLMISFCEEKEISSVIKQISSTTNSCIDYNYILTNSRRMDQWGFSTIDCDAFLRDEPESGNVSSRQRLFKNISTEISKRKKLLKSKKNMSFEKYYSLNLWNAKKTIYRFLLIDDVWDVLTSKPQTLGLGLMRIIIYGPEVGIHTVLGSGISYRNLLQQLVNSNPSITKILQEKYGVPEPTSISAISKELIYSPDGLIFLRNENALLMEKFYPIV